MNKPAWLTVARLAQTVCALSVVHRRSQAKRRRASLIHETGVPGEKERGGRKGARELLTANRSPVPRNAGGSSHEHAR